MAGVWLEETVILHKVHTYLERPPKSYFILVDSPLRVGGGKGLSTKDFFCFFCLFFLICSRSLDH